MSRAPLPHLATRAINARLAYRRAHRAELETARRYEGGDATATELRKACGATHRALAAAVQAGCDASALADDGARLELEYTGRS